MRVKINRWLACMLAVVFLFAGSSLQVFAVSGKVTFNDPSVTQGENVTVSMTVSSDGSLGALDASLTYDASLLQFVDGSGPNGMMVSGGSGGVSVSWYNASGASSVTCNLVFKTLGSGTATVSAPYVEATAVDESGVTLSSIGSSKVTIKPPYNASTEARLSALQVGPGRLSPAFSSDVYTYSTRVESDVTKLVISATPMDAKASYRVTWNSLDPGDNVTYIDVTAESGATKRYTIKTYREIPEEEDPKETTKAPEPTTQAPTDAPTAEVPVGGLTAVIDGTTWYVATNLDGITLPEGFEAQSVTYADTEIGAAKGLAKPLTLLWLTDVNGENGSFFIYDEETDHFTKFVNVPVGQKVYTIMPVDDTVEIPEGFIPTTMAIHGEVVEAWIAEKDMTTNFVLVHAMNWNGETSLYRYDAVEETMQRYVRETLEEEKTPNEEEISDSKVTELENRLAKMKETYENELKKKSQTMWILVGLCVVSVILLILSLVLRKSPKEEKEAAQKAVKKAPSQAKKKPAEAGKRPAEGAQKKRPAEGAPKRRPTEEVPKRRPVEPGEMPAQPRKCRPRPVEAAAVATSLAAEAAITAEPKECPEAPITKTPAPIEKPVTKNVPEHEDVAMSATAALLKELEAMEQKIKSNSAAPIEVDEEDDFEMIDLE